MSVKGSGTVPVKECQYLTDRTSIREGISIGIADHGDGGLEIVVAVHEKKASNSNLRSLVHNCIFVVSVLILEPLRP
ncbi:hypothetical protein G5714_023407 [Onychostoma macrolepis]|uniref:Uncharacterized protein n=1 Tax=Onychostoma macrolepis TaxID=369639 RepID=A0A7J6BLG8_9TELE|nr:hypothetical protein G5714_023407 [Onychostoma macrolepis]